MRFKTGTIFWADEQAIVIPISCDGVLYTGISAQARELIPDNNISVRYGCQNKYLDIDSIWIYFDNVSRKFFFNTPNKVNWRNKTLLGRIEKKLFQIIETARKYKISSVAIPSMGTDSSGLDFESDIQPLYKKILTKITDVKITCYRPIKIYGANLLKGGKE